ncbi:protease [Clostridia bacterium]|nr:protease [Clostridia bacterium]
MNQKSTSSAVLSIFIPLILYLVVSTIVGAIAGIVLGFRLGIDALSELPKYTIFIVLLTNIVLFLIFYPLYIRDKRNHSYTKKDTISFKQIILLLLLSIGACISLNSLISLSPLMELFPRSQEVLASIYGHNLWLEIISVGIIAPIVEELLCRGLIFRRLRTILNFRFSLILSALIFAIIHGNMVQGLYAFTLGLILAYFYEKTSNLLYPIIIHIFANICSVLISEVPILRQGMEAMEANILYFILFTVITLIAAIFFGIALRKSLATTDEVTNHIETE